MAHQQPAMRIPSTQPEEPGAEQRASKRSTLTLIDPEPLAKELKLPSGRTVTVSAANHEQLFVKSPSGEIELTIGFSAQGPVLRFTSAGLEFSTEGAISMDCASLRLHAREHIEIASDGELHQKAQQRQVMQAGTQLHMEAPDISAHATQGQVELAAHEDVVLLGERVRLNC